MGPSRAQMLGADPEGVAVRELVKEMRALPKAELPSGGEWFVNHPGLLTYRTKGPQSYDQGQRTAHFLERAKEAGIANVPDAAVAEMKSAYEPYGADWPLYNTARWFSSLPGAVYATGQMLANKMDPEVTHFPDAADDYAKNMNNLLFFMDEPFGKNKNQMRDMSDMRDAIDSNPGAADEIRAHYEDKADPKTGREMLEESNVDQLIGRLGTRALGGTMDATVDPFFGGPKLAGVIADYLLGSSHETLPLAIDAGKWMGKKLGEARDYFGEGGAYR